MSPKARARKVPEATPSAARERLSALGRAALGALASEDGARAVLVVLVASAIVAASLRVRERVLAREDLELDRGALEARLTADLGPGAAADLAALPLPPRVSAFHPALVPAFARSLRDLAWVDRVESVRLDYPPRLGFTLRPLAPLARIREGGREWLVARDGRSVPPGKLARALDGFPRLEGLPPEARPADRARALDAGLALVVALEGRGLASRLGLVAVDVSNWDGRVSPLASELVIETASGTKLDWGRPAGAPRAPGLEERLKTLEHFLARGPRLDTLARVSMRWRDPVVVPRPVAEAAPVETAARPARGR